MYLGPTIAERLSASWLGECFACMSFHAVAQTSIKWGTDYWQDYTNYDGSGFYNELIHKIFPEPEYIVEVHYYPWKRSVKNVLQGNIDMTGAMHKSERLYHSERPVLIDTVVMVSRVEDALTLDSLDNKLGAYRSGYEDMVFYPYLKEATMGMEVEDSYKGLTLLAMNKLFLRLHCSFFGIFSYKWLHHYYGLKWQTPLITVIGTLALE